MKIILRLYIVFFGLWLISTPINALTIKSNQKEVLEVVIFKTQKGVNQQALIRTSNQVTKILQSYSGFISRKLSTNTDMPNQWIDIVHWASLQDASLAAKKIIHTQAMKRFIGFMQTYQMSHFYIKTKETNTKNIEF